VPSSMTWTSRCRRRPRRAREVSFSAWFTRDD
jgi:hypothetical protein